MAEISDEGLHGISESGNSHSQCVGSKARKPAEIGYQHPSRRGNIYDVCAMTELTGLSCKNAAIGADAVKAEYSYHIELALGLLLAFRLFGSAPSS